MTNFTDATTLLRERIFDPEDNCIIFVRGSDFDDAMTLVVEVAELAVEYWQLWQDADTEGKITDLARMMEIDDRLQQLLSGAPESKGEEE